MNVMKNRIQIMIAAMLLIFSLGKVSAQEVTMQSLLREMVIGKNWRNSQRKFHTEPYRQAAITVLRFLRISRDGLQTRTGFPASVRKK